MVLLVPGCWEGRRRRPFCCSGPGSSVSGRARAVVVLAFVLAVRVPGTAVGRGGCERGEGLAAAPAGFRGQAFGGAALVFFLPGIPCGEDALVADDEQGDSEQHEGRQAHEAAPAAADVVAGGVLGGGEAALGAGAAGVGAAPGRRRVVVLLPGLGADLGRDGDGLLRAAGLGVFRGLQDLGPVPVQEHRRGAQRAADLARGGRALHPVVAVFVVGGEAAELVAGQLAGWRSWPAACSWVAARASGPSPAAAGRARGSTRFPLLMTAPSCVPLGPRSCGWRSCTSWAPAVAQRQRPGAGVAVGVAGIIEDVAERDPLCGHRGQHGGEDPDRVVLARGHRGAAGGSRAAGPFSSPVMTPADRCHPKNSSSSLVQQVVPAVPPGGLGAGVVAGAVRRGPERSTPRSVQSTASDRLTSLNWPGTDASSSWSQAA